LEFIHPSLALGITRENGVDHTDSVSADSVKKQYADQDEIAMDDDFSPGMLFMLLLGFAFILFCVGAGIVLTVLFLLVLFALVSAGILSISTFVGLNKRSFSKGFKMFLLLSSTTGGIVMGGVIFWLLNQIFQWATTATAVMSGVAVGFITGLIFGFFCFHILQKLSTHLRSRLLQR
jgi:hypothetical protein